jgi:hypothetical protein
MGQDDKVEKLGDGKTQDEKSDTEVVLELHSRCFYWHPTNFTKIVGNNKLLYGIWGGIFYLG